MRRGYRLRLGGVCLAGASCQFAVIIYGVIIESLTALCGISRFVGKDVGKSILSAGYMPGAP